jgi:hypothetical protein
MDPCVQLTDGIVVDHLAELSYYPKKQLFSLYSDDRVGYVDAVARGIQLVVTSDGLVFSNNIAKSTTAQLRDALKGGGKAHEDAALFSKETREQWRPRALYWVHLNWTKIEDALRNSPETLDALQGHMKREFRQCFLLPPTRRQSMSHYVEPEDAKVLWDEAREYLLSMLGPAVHESRLPVAAVASWLDRTVTTVYRIFAEYALSSPYEYTPARTRSGLSFAVAGHGHDSLTLVARCVAVDVLERRRITRRRDFVPQMLEWAHTRRGRAVRQGYESLRQAMRTGDRKEKEELIGHAKAVLESDKGLVLGVTLGFMQIVKELITFQEPKGNVAINTPRELRWLYNVRRPAAHLRLQNLVDELVTRPA